MILPLFATLDLALYTRVEGKSVFAGLANFRTLFGDPRWSASFWNALGNNAWFFIDPHAVPEPDRHRCSPPCSPRPGCGAAFYRTAIFVPTILSFVIVGFAWKLILSPLWGIAPSMFDAVGLKSLFGPFLGKPGTRSPRSALISVWQFIGIPMMLIYAALLSIPDEILEAAECDGITGFGRSSARSSCR